MKLTDTEIQLISDLSHKQVELEAEVASLEAQLKDAKQQLSFVSQVELPNAMAELGVASITLTNGAKVEVSQKYYASIPAEKKAEAFQWLTENGLDSVIKNVVSCQFGKGENSLAKSAMQELVSLGFQAQQDMSIHPMTLKSLVKDLFQRGVEFPLETFGAGTVSESKVIQKK